jgi:peroxiredoxin Q/BCP
LFFSLQAKSDPELVVEKEEEEAEDSSTLPSIDIGGSLPELTLKNEKGEDIQVANLASEKGVIIFLVPKADTRA